MTTAPDETTYRKPGGLRPGSIPVAMDDGSTWYLPPRGTRFRPAYDEDRKPRLVRSSDLGRDHDALVEAMDVALAGLSADDGPPLADVVATMFEVAVSLLRVNYDLPDEVLPGLISYSVDGSTAPLWTQVIAIARGVPVDVEAPALATAEG